VIGQQWTRLCRINIHTFSETVTNGLSGNACGCRVKTNDYGLSVTS